MNTAELLIDLLGHFGVKYIFGVPGGAIEDLNTAIYHNKRGIMPIVTKHEAGAAFMADGYARDSGRLGVCCTTAGPGASNLITGLASAHADQIPVLALTGQVATSVFGKGAIQESATEGMDITDIFRHITKYSGMLITESRAQYMLQKAVRLAMTGPSGPVHLNLPTDLMKREIDRQRLCAPESESRLFGDERVREAARLLVAAKKPVIIAGWGVILSRAANELLELAQILQVPVATSPKAKGVFPESHPLSLGVLGFAGNPLAQEYIFDTEVDVMLGVGTSFSEMMTGGWDERLRPAEHLIHIDINPEKIGKNYCTSVGLVGDARMNLKELSKAIIEERSQQYARIRGNGVADRIADLRKKQPPEQTDFSTSGSLYHPRQLVHDVQRSFPADTIYFADIGTSMAWAIRHMTIDRLRLHGLCGGRPGRGQTGDAGAPGGGHGGGRLFSDERHRSGHGRKLRHPGDLGGLQQRHARHGLSWPQAVPDPGAGRTALPLQAGRLRHGGGRAGRPRHPPGQGQPAHPGAGPGDHPVKTTDRA